MQNRQPTSSRRHFFAGAATVSAAAAAVAVLPGVVAPEATPTADAKPTPPERGGGYHLSAHVRQYYKTTLL